MGHDVSSSAFCFHPSPRPSNGALTKPNEGIRSQIPLSHLVPIASFELSGDLVQEAKGQFTWIALGCDGQVDAGVRCRLWWWGMHQVAVGVFANGEHNGGRKTERVILSVILPQ